MTSDFFDQLKLSGRPIERAYALQRAMTKARFKPQKIARSAGKKRQTRRVLQEARRGAEKAQEAANALDAACKIARDVGQKALDAEKAGRKALDSVDPLDMSNDAWNAVYEAEDAAALAAVAALDEALVLFPRSGGTITMSVHDFEIIN
ncbi:hypothetical protein [Nitratireductor sp. XY-223]|uniref:hypothetical protein n=1 Tax=Nitratireductor sp. XY-223 TaxID=2561926 RepID=UPI0010AAA02C|nr:hypothetical protein [Nitratireductor sp. XY-223]